MRVRQQRTGRPDVQIAGDGATHSQPSIKPPSKPAFSRATRMRTDTEQCVPGRIALVWAQLRTRPALDRSDVLMQGANQPVLLREEGILDLGWRRDPVARTDDRHRPI